MSFDFSLKGDYKVYKDTKSYKQHKKYGVQRTDLNVVYWGSTIVRALNSMLNQNFLKEDIPKHPEWFRFSIKEDMKLYELDKYLLKEYPEMFL